MRQKKFFSLLALIAVMSIASTGCGTSQPAAAATNAVETTQADPAKVIEDITTIQAFTEDAVSDADVQAIVNAGINAPSAMNGQPWHFSVVTDADVLKQISDDMSKGMPAGMKPPAGATPPNADKPAGDKPMVPPTANGVKAGIADAPLVIIVSCKDGSDLDAGLATENMAAEAQLLGYGTKIISSPKIALNGEKQAEYKELLDIPEDMAAVSMLLIGKTDTEKYDAVTSATVRKDEAEIVSYIKK